MTTFGFRADSNPRSSPYAPHQGPSLGAPSFWNHYRSTRIVHIDFEPAEIDSHYPVVLDIQADIADALWQITEALNRRFDDEGRLPLFDIGERRKLRDAIRDDLTMKKDDASFPMKPQKILWDVRQHLRRGDTFGHLAAGDATTTLAVQVSRDLRLEECGGAGGK